MMKPITFYQWLAQTGQMDMDPYEPCECCNGKGRITEEDAYEEEHAVKCQSCDGTGNALYQDYLKQVEKDKQMLSQWGCRQMAVGAGV
jgi:DnaJ-class molecular chaperone